MQEKTEKSWLQRRKLYRIATDGALHQEVGELPIRKGLEIELANAKIAEDDYVDLRDQSKSPFMKSFARNLGAHVALTVAFQFAIPLTSNFLRSGWVIGKRVKLRRDQKNGKIPEEDFEVNKALHHLGIALPISFIPFGGAWLRIRSPQSGLPTRA
ncbi:MAG: hypothetical protein V1835_03280 [Candidatus Micrarchaeota archaeon]